MTDSRQMADPFPEPPGFVASVLAELRLAASATNEPDAETRRVQEIKRPWDPASCDEELRECVYRWLDAVVAWINEDHTWRTDQVVPICWDLHPHLVHELATIACLRWEATFARTPGPLEEWQRRTLPEFLNRIADRIGDTGCPPGRHQPNPGTGRNDISRSQKEQKQRHGRRSADRMTTTERLGVGPIPDA